MIEINHIEYNAIQTAHKVFAYYADRNKLVKKWLKSNTNWKEIMKVMISMARSDIKSGGHELARIFITDVYFRSMNHKLIYQIAVETYS